MNEHEATTLLDRLSSTLPVGPTPVDAILDAGTVAKTRRRRQWALLVGAGSLAVVALLVGVVSSLPKTGDHSDGPTSPATSTAPAGWENMTGTALAEALGLIPVPHGEVNSTFQCSGDDGINDKYVLTFKGGPEALAYCYLPEEHGITDPVAAELLRWQLVGVPRSPDLLKLAEVQAEFHQLMNNISASNGTVSIEQVLPYQTQIDELMERLFPPNGQLGPWLNAHPEFTNPVDTSGD